jgi:hypothetical protein
MYKWTKENSTTKDNQKNTLLDLNVEQEGY